MTDTTFQSLGLADELLAAISAAGYTVPTPIQAQSIRPLLAGKDLLGLAETGTGKTAAFTLPILQKLSQIAEPVAPRCCRALILAPTRELAIQIGESVETYGKGYKLSHTVIFGGVGPRSQIRAMDRGVDILIATPGRLLDLMGTRNVRLDRVQFFVLDEADRMLDMGFIRDVKRIIRELPKVRQSLLFSATMPEDISSLAHEILHNPVRVEVARAGKTVDRIEQFVHFVDTKSKRAALAALLQDAAMSRVIVFTRTKHGADRVARGLGASGIGAFAIHGNKSQNARQAALESFRNGKARVLVATDIAARGIDIDEITHVVNFDIPNIPESYVHRIGRTARAGNAGIAIALCAPEERSYLRDIERLTRRQLVQAPAIAGLAEVAASLPPVPNRGPDDDEGQTFVRGRGQLAGRRHMPHVRSTTAWHEGDAARGGEHRKDDARRGRNNGERGHDGGRGERSQERHDRPRSEHSGDRRENRVDRSERGEHQFRQKPRDGAKIEGARDERRNFERNDMSGRGGGQRNRQEGGINPTPREGIKARPPRDSGERQVFGRTGAEAKSQGLRGDKPRLGNGERTGEGPNGQRHQRRFDGNRNDVRRPVGSDNRGPNEARPEPWRRPAQRPHAESPATGNAGRDRKPSQERERSGERGRDEGRRESTHSAQRPHDGRPPHRWQRARGGDEPRQVSRERAKPE